jgi:molecular chaperone GrpE
MSKRDEPINEIDQDNGDEPMVPQQASDGDADRIAELTADLKRVQADFVNFRRRAETEKAEVFDLAKNRIVRDFLSVRDSFDQELAHRPATVDPAWAASIDSIRTQFDQVLKGLGVDRFDSKGVPFDPHLHDAIAMEDGEGDQEVVVEEMQPGYKRGDQVVRHAVVKVGKTSHAPAAGAQPEPALEPDEPADGDATA